MNSAVFLELDQLRMLQLTGLSVLSVLNPFV